MKIATSSNKPTSSNNLLENKTIQNHLSVQVNNNDKEDFWMPAANTKVKKTEMLSSIPLKLITQDDELPKSAVPLLLKHQPQQLNIALPNKCQAETQILKSLLGLGNAIPSSHEPDQFRVIRFSYLYEQINTIIVMSSKLVFSGTALNLEKQCSKQ